MSILTSMGLILAGVIAIIIEFFVPSAGIIGVIGFGSIVGGIVTVYIHHGTALGTVFLIAALITTPVVMVLYFKLFPRSFIGKWLILRKEMKSEEGFSSGQEVKFDEMIGSEGVTLSMLRPSGTALIGGRKTSVVTGGEFIEKDSKIRVVKVEGNRILVRKGD